MQLLVEASPLEANRCLIRAEHNGESILFSVGSDFKDIPKGLAEGNQQLFRQYNSYVAFKPPAVQQALFDQYRYAHDLFQMPRDASGRTMSVTTLNQELTKVVNNILQWFPLPELEQHVQFATDIIIPSTLDAAFQTNEPVPTFSANEEDGLVETRRTIGTADKTYLRQDYIELVAFLLAMRAILPIWVSYIGDKEAAVKEIGIQWKEWSAFHLMQGTPHYDSHALQRMYRYINAFIAVDDSLASAIMGGVSRDDFPIWTAASVITRKLALADISGITRVDVRNNRPKGPLLLSILNRRVDTKINTHHTDFMGRVNEKKPIGEDPNDNRYSLFEATRARQSISPADILHNAIPFENIFQAAENFYPRVPRELLKLTHAASISFNQPIDLAEIMGEAMDNVFLPQNSRIDAILQPWQETIIEGVLKRAIFSRTVHVMKRPVGSNMLALAAAILITDGFPDIAMVLLATDCGSATYESKIVVEKFSKESLALLAQTYPDAYVTRKKDKVENNGVLLLNQMVRRIASSTLLNNLQPKFHVPPELAFYMPRLVGRKIALNQHFRNRLAQLFYSLHCVQSI